MLNKQALIRIVIIRAEKTALYGEWFKFRYLMNHEKLMIVGFVVLSLVAHVH